MPEPVNSFLSSIRDFTPQGHSLHNPSKLDQHVLNGRSKLTLKSNNSAVRKFLAFIKASRKTPSILPATKDNIYGFCFWAGKKDTDKGESGVLSVTLKKYLQGLKAWNIFHDSPYPLISEKKVALLLKSSLKLEALAAKRVPKNPVMIEHFVVLANDLASGDLEDAAILDLALVSFWSLARLGEVTHDQSNPGCKILQHDVTVSHDGRSESIELKESKTALLGESQFLQLKLVPNCLCPVRAMTQRISSWGQSDHIFGYSNKGRYLALMKYSVKRRLLAIWTTHGFDGLSGHSFRVGGTSFHNALGISPTQICKLGRWASVSYKLYIRVYSSDDLSSSLETLSQLDLQWRLT
ncbi:uncharacterized protein PGTG_18086 [Puccinia graminis f. sp. tritici CRL 75-36-700-3]|uniref:Tyr recombinase domain-containing protein n=1 Tax=Puccinia graminis f. sp. tritici (strain CRL 75-36-700-3 / race SCCL) TaxID=418459 RepID=E3L6L4_PUCGT|nr:uncharacterized protein PGTG_18086 [Puccinia graminis f. sp. tritici CRL 75-36-700-3]EFP92189.2 hypothetical protein PGTG_18086 [Puccinia graminis f. sp. tritici CRL 75-36-700-3]